MEPLRRVHARVRGRRPARRKHGRGFPLRCACADPVDQQGDGVLGPGDAAESLRSAGRSARGHFHGGTPLVEHPGADVDVVLV